MMKKHQIAENRPNSQPSALLLVPTSEVSLLDPQNITKPTLVAINTANHGSASHLFPADDIEVDSFLGQTPAPLLKDPKGSSNPSQQNMSFSRPSSYPNLVNQSFQFTNVSVGLPAQNMPNQLASLPHNSNKDFNKTTLPHVPNSSLNSKQITETPHYMGSIVATNMQNVSENNMGFNTRLSTPSVGYANMFSSPSGEAASISENILPPKASTASNFRMVGRVQYALPQDMHGYKSSQASSCTISNQQILPNYDLNMPIFAPSQDSNLVLPSNQLFTPLTHQHNQYPANDNNNFVSIATTSQYMESGNSGEHQSTVPFNYYPPEQQYNMGASSPVEMDMNLVYKAPIYHWFYIKVVEGNSLWQPFPYKDSRKIEDMHNLGSPNGQRISVIGERYEVDVGNRRMQAIYWEEKEFEIRRCLWFLKLDTTYELVPLDEEFCAELEESYRLTTTSGDYHKKLVFSNGHVVVIHSPESIICYQNSPSTLTNPWDANNAENRPQVIKRGISDFHDINEGESDRIDHLVFVIGGLGSTYGLKNQLFIDCVDRFRSVSDQMLSEHFDQQSVGRVEFLPIIYQDFDKEAILQINNKLKSTTLTSMAKLRYFTNETLLDILYYMSPSHASITAVSIGNHLNLIYERFKLRNPSFKGAVSIIGHGTGGLQIFDLLLNQKTVDEDVIMNTQSAQNIVQKASNCPPKDISEVLSHLNLEEFQPIFLSEKLDLQALRLCTDGDFKEMGLPLGPRKKIIDYLQSQTLSTLKETPNHNLHSEQTKKNEVLFSESLAGGVDSQILVFSKLEFHVSNFFALGAPIGLILSLKGVQFLGDEFVLPTCSSFFNLFHPFDPLAYRIESLIVPHAPVKPLCIPHHKGRKRMHLELKENLVRIGYDIKQRITDSIRSTWKALHQLAIGGNNSSSPTSPSMEKEVQSQVEEVLSQLTRENNLSDDNYSVATASVADESEIQIGSLNQGRRVDHVLQERPLEIFNDFIFGVSSSACYWNSEDTALFILKEIYLVLGIIPKKSSSNSRFAQAQPPKSGFIPPKQVSLPSTDSFMPVPFSGVIKPMGQRYPQIAKSMTPTMNYPQGHTPEINGGTQLQPPPMGGFVKL